MKNYRFNKNVLFIILLLILSTTVILYSYTTGITGHTKKTGIGCTCHNSQPSSNVVVKISGPDTLTVDQKADYSVTITGGPLKAAGVDIAISVGKLSPLNSDLRLMNGELTHSYPIQPTNNKVTFSFSYQAPSMLGNFKIYATGNSVNFNGYNDTGDKWNFAPNKIVKVISPTSVNDKLSISIKQYTLKQNYPNPFNPSTTIAYSLPKNSFVELNIYNLLGNKVAQLVNDEQSSGIHTVKFSPEELKAEGINLPSGVYLYRIKAGNYSMTRKMIYLK